MSRAGSALALAFTLAVSLAANITWAARDHDPVAIAAGIATPIALVMAVHQWRAHMGARGYQRVLKVLGMAAVTGTAAAWTWTHTTRLLLAHNIETPLAYIAPLAIDGLAVMATMALWPTVRPTEDTGMTESVSSRPDTAVPSQHTEPLEETTVPGSPASTAQPVQVATWDEFDGPVGVPHPAGSIPGWDAPATDPDGFPVPARIGQEDETPTTTLLPVSLQVTPGTASEDEQQRPTADDIAAELADWPAVPGIGTIASTWNVGKAKAGRAKRIAEDARGTSQDDDEDADPRPTAVGE